MVQPHISTIFPHLESEPKAAVSTEENVPTVPTAEKNRISWSDVSIDNGDENYPNEPDESKIAPKLAAPIFVPASVSGATTHNDASSTRSSDAENQADCEKRNRLQECKLCCCRPMVIIIICAFLFLLIAAIIAIIFSIVADNTEMRLEELGDGLKPYSVNLNELPQALQEQVMRGIQVRGMNNPQYFPNGQSQQQQNAGAQYSSPSPSYGYPHYGNR